MEKVIAKAYFTGNSSFRLKIRQINQYELSAAALHVQNSPLKEKMKLKDIQHLFKLFQCCFVVILKFFYEFIKHCEGLNLTGRDAAVNLLTRNDPQVFSEFPFKCS